MSQQKLGKVLIFQLLSRRHSPLFKASHCNAVFTHLQDVGWLFRNLPVWIKLILCSVTPQKRSAFERCSTWHILSWVFTFSKLTQTGTIWLPLLTERFCKTEISRTATGRSLGPSYHPPSPGNPALGQLQGENMTHQHQGYIEKQIFILMIVLLF